MPSAAVTSYKPTTVYLSGLGTAVQAHLRHDLARARGRRVTTGCLTIQPGPRQWVRTLEVTRAQGIRALVRWETIYSCRRASAGGTAMARRAGHRQARSALRARRAAAAKRLPAA